MLSSSMFYVYFKTIYPNINIQPFFHHVNPKAHGLGDDDVFEQIKSCEPSLLVMLDAGSGDLERSRKLRELGFDICCADHHSFKVWNKECVLVNNHMSKNVTNKGLCGTGVTWKCLKRYDELYGYNIANSLISYVAFANVSDSMLLTYQENRAFAKWGFKRVHKNIKPFFDEFIKDDVTNESVAWNVTPKGNALIRIGELQDKIDLFYALCGEYDHADIIARMKSYHTKQNTSKTKLMEDVDIVYKGTCILAKMKTKTALTGLIANSLSSQYLKPILLINQNNDDNIDTYGGSCRSVVPIKKQLLDSGLFEHCDGHEDYAFGVQYKKENEQAIIDYLDTVVSVSEPCTDVLISSSLECLPTSLYSLKMAYNDLWSKGVESPIVHIPPFTINSHDIQLLGKDKRTMKFNKDGVDFMLFRISNQTKADFHVDDKKNIKLSVEIIGEPSLNVYMGRSKKQIMIDKYEVNVIEDKILDWEDLF